MKIYDISQKVFGCAVWPGDPMPKQEMLEQIDKGSKYNLTAFSMCAHNGTHIDAPYHFIAGGKTIEEMPLEHFVGMAYVAKWDGELSAEGAMSILEQARGMDDTAAKRILIKGNAVVSLEAASVFAGAGILLLGNESQTVGPEDAPMAVHLKLLSADIALLEGIRLAEVPVGFYYLNAVPLNLGASDGAPCRAVLVEMG